MLKIKAYFWRQNTFAISYQYSPMLSYHHQFQKSFSDKTIFREKTGSSQRGFSAKHQGWHVPYVSLDVTKLVIGKSIFFHSRFSLVIFSKNAYPGATSYRNLITRQVAKLNCSALTIAFVYFFLADYLTLFFETHKKFKLAMFSLRRFYFFPEIAISIRSSDFTNQFFSLICLIVYQPAKFLRKF